MIEWAARKVQEPPASRTTARDRPANPLRVIDPGCGSGRFLTAAAERFPTAELIGIDTDPVATLLLRANAAVRGFARRLTVHVGDYRDLTLPAIPGATLFVGNPPYVRHHEIPERWKDWFSRTAARYGLKASKLAGLHIHFFLKTRELARAGDYGVFITSAEWLDVNYGSVLRALLNDGLHGLAIHILEPQLRPFADAITTGAITCFRWATIRAPCASVASGTSPNCAISQMTRVGLSRAPCCAPLENGLTSQRRRLVRDPMPTPRSIAPLLARTGTPAFDGADPDS